MNLDYLNYLKKKKGMVSIALIGISSFLAILILIKVAGFFVASARAENLLENAVAKNKVDTKQVEKYLTDSKTIADELKRKNLFAPPPPKQQPIKQVWGILGNEVLINDKWYKVGDMIQDAKIVAIEPVRIKVEWDGREITLAPIDAVSSSPVGPKPKGPEVAKAGTGGRAEMVAVRPEGSQMFGRGDRGGDGRFRPGDRTQLGEGIRERLQNMSERDKERLRAEMQRRREQFMRMSPEQRQRNVEELRRSFGGGRPTGGGPGGGRGPGGRR